VDDTASSEAGYEDAQLAIAERVVLAAVVQKLRAAALMLEGHWRELPSDEAVTEAGVIAARASEMLESVFEGRVAVRGQRGES